MFNDLDYYLGKCDADNLEELLNKGVQKYPPIGSSNIESLINSIREHYIPGSLEQEQRVVHPSISSPIYTAIFTNGFQKEQEKIFKREP